MNSMRRLFLSAATLLVIGLAVPARVGAQAPPPDFWAAQKQREQARATRDRATFDRLTTDGFIVVDAMGRLGDKKERLERMGRAGGGGRGGPFVATQKMNERVSLYNGDTVVLYWQQNAPEGLEHVTEVWVREAGQWKVAAAHVARAQ
jgi:hypothetical protein